MEEAAEEIRLVRANNAGPMTGLGTNSWILGRERPIIVDPGPDDPAHLARLLSETGAEAHLIIITHAHDDHAALALKLQAATDAPIMAIDPCIWPPRSGLLGKLPDRPSFNAIAPDIPLIDGTRIETGEMALTVLHVPGHSPDHLALEIGGTLICGDLILPDRPSIVAAPEGSIPHMMESLQRIAKGAWRRGLPGHGAPIGDLQSRAGFLLAHRKQRLDAIQALLGPGWITADEIANHVYSEVPPPLRPAAQASVLCHLAALEECGIAVLQGTPDFLQARSV